jgi:hypothetical protein
MPTGISNTHDKFPQTFLITRARTTTMEPELERSSIAKGNGVGLGKTGRRAGFAEGSVLLLVLESILANFSSPPSLLQESRIYPHLLRSYFTCGFLDFFGLPDLFFFHIIPLSYVALINLFSKNTVLHPIDSPPPLNVFLLRS